MKIFNLAGRATGKTHCLRSSATIPGGAEAGRTFTPTRDHRATEGDKDAGSQKAKRIRLIYVIRFLFT